MAVLQALILDALYKRLSADGMADARIEQLRGLLNAEGKPKPEELARVLAGPDEAVPSLPK